MFRTTCRFAMLAVAVLTCHAIAQTKPPAVGGKTDMNIYPVPPGFTLPQAGETFVDPTFGTKILRVTDERDGKSNHLSYSYYPTFNKDSTRIMYCSNNDGVICTFDAKLFKIGPKEPLFKKNTPAGSHPRWEDAIWSGTEPDCMFAHDMQRLWKLNVKTGEYTLVKDFKKDLGDGIKQLSRSIDDNVFAFTTTDGEKQTGALAWSRKDDKELFRDKEADLDEVQVDKSGGYLVVKRNHRGKDVVWVRVVDLKTQKVEGLIDTAPDYATGHSDNGTGTCIGSDDKMNRFLLRKLATPHKFISILDMKNDWTNACHISALADDEKWCVVSFYEWNPATKPGPLHSEIVMVKTDGSQAVRRLAHHRSVLNQQYWNCPFANISRDGRFIAFGSNVDGKGQCDVFVLKVPEFPAGK